MTLHTWLLFLVTETLLSLSPGPAVFYAISHGLRGGVPRTLPAALGVISANGVYFVLSATSLGALIVTSPSFFIAVRWLGAAYLGYLGLSILLSLRSAHAVNLRTGIQSAPVNDSRRIYAGAVALQLANPKALLFFLALLPQFIDPQQPIVTQMTVLALTSMLPEFCILLSYGGLAGRAVRASTQLGISQRLQRGLTLTEGIAMLACAALVLSFRR